MGEVREEKELQLELTRMRNPYLEEEFRNTPRRRKGTASGSGLRTEGKFVGEKAYPRAAGRSRERLMEAKAYPRTAGRDNRGRTETEISVQSAVGGAKRVEARAHTQSSVQNNRKSVDADIYQNGRKRAANTYSQSVGIRVETRVQMRRTETGRERQKRLQQLQRRRKLSFVLIASFAAVCLFWWLTSLFLKKGEAQHVNAGGIVSAGDYLSQDAKQVLSLPVKPDLTENFLTPNEYSRPGEPLERVDNIFVHYTANAGTSAAQNRSYFEQLKDTHERSASAHFIIGYEGEILQIIPLDEIAYAVQTRNYDSISIECCYLAEDGSFTKETYESLINLLVWLLEIYNLEPQDILRHYDCGGKKCPLYYTEHVDEWEKLKEEVGERLAGNLLP